MLKIDTVETQEQVLLVEKLAQEIWHSYYLKMNTVEQIDYMLKNFQSKEAITRQVNDENYTYKMLYKDENPIGYYAATLREDNISQYLFLSKLYLKDEFRGCGIGKITFDDIKSLAKRLKQDRIILSVNKLNTNAIKAYTKWGFKLMHSIKLDIGNGYFMDDFIMEYSSN